MARYSRQDDGMTDGREIWRAKTSVPNGVIAGRGCDGSAVYVKKVA